MAGPSSWFLIVPFVPQQAAAAPGGARGRPCTHPAEPLHRHHRQQLISRQKQLLRASNCGVIKLAWLGLRRELQRVRVKAPVLQLEPHCQPWLTTASAAASTPFLRTLLLRRDICATQSCTGSGGPPMPALWVWRLGASRSTWPPAGHQALGCNAMGVDAASCCQLGGMGSTSLTQLGWSCCAGHAVLAWVPSLDSKPIMSRIGGPSEPAREECNRIVFRIAQAQAGRTRWAGMPGLQPCRRHHFPDPCPPVQWPPKLGAARSDGANSYMNSTEHLCCLYASSSQ